MKKMIVFIGFFGLLLAASFSQAASIENLYGKWSGIWTLDTLYFNNGGNIESYFKQPDGTWSGDGRLKGYFDWWLYPNDPKSFSMVLNAPDAGGSYGNIKAELSRGNFFTGNVNAITFDGSTNQFLLSIDYASGDSASIYGTFDGSSFSGVRFDETYPPLPSYIIGQGNLELSAVPEPATLILLGLGFLGVLPLRKRMK